MDWLKIFFKKLSEQNDKMSRENLDPEQGKR